MPRAQRAIDYFARQAGRLATRIAPAHADETAATVSELCHEAYRRRGWIALVTTGALECLDLARQIAVVRTGRAAHITDAPGPSPNGIHRPKGAFAMAFDDLKHALRRLRGHPGSALLATGMLGLAIGISAAMFTVFDALVLSPAPFKDAATLTWIGFGNDAQHVDVNLARPLAQAWRSNRGFAGVYAIRQEPARFGSGDAVETVAGARITPGLLEELGVTPILGRTFAAGEGRTGADDLVILAETTWRSRFGADAAIVGKRVQISGAPLLVVGVLPASFRFPFFRTALWRPFDLDAPAPPHNQPRALVYAYARLNRDVPREDTARMAADIAQSIDPRPEKRVVQLRPIGDRYLDAYSSGTVKVLAAGVALVFLVLCVNVTNLMLARLSARRREFALCSALGASRTRLVSQAIWEQAVIGAASFALGLAVAAGLVALARSSLPASIVGATLHPLAVDVRALLATSLLGGLAVVIAGALPAIVGTRGDVSKQFQGASRAATQERATRRTTTALVVAEVALAIALSVAAGIQLRSFVNLLHEDRGFDVDRLLTFALSLPGGQIPDSAARYAYSETVRRAVQATAGVEGATISFGVPPGGGSLYFYSATSDLPGAIPVPLVLNGYDVAPEFFSVLGIRLIEGRTFRIGDDPDAAIISRSMADTLWPGASPLDHTMSFMKRTFRVVGVTAEIRNPSGDPRDDQPEIYLPLLRPAAAGGAGPALEAGSVTLTVRCAATCPSFDALRAAIKSAAPVSAVGAGKRVADDYAARFERPRSAAIVAAAFAAIGLFAVGGGVFAVLSRVVLQRQREFGIRLALGATPADLERLVYRNSAGVLAGGLALGISIAWALARALAAVQYQVRVQDGLTWTIVIAVMCLTVFAAAWRPARRAMRVDPVGLLREE